ncbi:hypothetical protein MVEN_02185400 [Mycena venus]|uniref:SnoaL-like domain-containing protein n=1 Tax=Mycena venus TaxID=2733690 RepID=A0A8H7CG40_9AGAR|nr:hypothetical protein MVEN_02185400 [Mycena venus]
MLSPLSDFIHDVFEQLVISPHDADATAALDTFFAPNFEEINVATGVVLDLAEYRKLVHSTRAQLTDRKLVSDKFILATPADPTHRTGGGAVIHVFTALQDGKRVTVTIVGVVRIEWVVDHKHGHQEGGSRRIVTESLIMNTSP